MDKKDLFLAVFENSVELFLLRLGLLLGQFLGSDLRSIERVVRAIGRRKGSDMETESEY